MNARRAAVCVGQAPPDTGGILLPHCHNPVDCGILPFPGSDPMILQPGRLRRRLSFPLATLPWVLALPLDAQAVQDLPPVMPRLPCTLNSFADVSLAEAPAQVTSVQTEDINGKAMCLVQGVISPQIRFIVRLPVAGWTQRYLQTGCGGLCGRLAIHSPQRDCAFERDDTLALASTDMGHTSGAGGIWAAADMQLRVDFGYRAVHATRLIAGELIHRYYGQSPKYTYFSGCSDGGREALMAVQRYPKDFDGVVAGAPSLVFTIQNSMYHGWNARIVQPDSDQPAIREDDLPILHRRAVQVCDAADGTTDGLVSDPTCKVDPWQWVCPDKAADPSRDIMNAGNCISPRTAAAVAEVYRGAHDGDHKLVLGSVLPGSELAWLRVLVPRNAVLQRQTQQRSSHDMSTPLHPSKTPSPAAPPPTKPAPNAHAAVPDTATPTRPPSPEGTPIDQVVLPPTARTVSLKSSSDIIPALAYPGAYDPHWKLANFRFTRESLQRLAPMHALLDASNPDLSAYRKAGGKVLIWHGLADPNITPMNAIAYWQAVRDLDPQADDMLRLFLIPGMYHCDRGDGLGSLDVTTPLMDWVEDGQAPETLFASASEVDARTGRGRPIQRFPYLTVLKPGGDPATPADWQRGRTIDIDPALYRNWAGAEFFKPGFQRFCGFSGLRFVCQP